MSRETAGEVDATIDLGRVSSVGAEGSPQPELARESRGGGPDTTPEHATVAYSDGSSPAARSRGQALSEHPELPGFEIVGELGRGGMGVVYKARQLGLNRLVALKMILAGGHAGESDLARFRAEAEAVARLKHPHIVQIHEIGEHQGRPYFALEFVEHGTLAGRLAQSSIGVFDSAELVETLARAVHYAHQQGIVHRDLKPANVLLAGPVAAAGSSAGLRGSRRGGRRTSTAVARAESLSIVPKIADFGLAKQLDADSGQTQSGAIVGTPSYMAPEQARGTGGGVGSSADIYSLGAMLYELLTGRPPFRAATILETLEQVRLQEPIAPGRIQPGLHKDVETICLKCLQKDSARRYATAEELADDLARFQAGEPIAARPVGRAERLWRWSRRRPLLAGLSAGVLLLAVAVTVVPTIMAISLDRARDAASNNATRARRSQLAAESSATEARAARKTAERESRIARHRHFAAQINLAHQAWEAGQVSRALALLEGLRPRFDEEDLRSFEWYHLFQLCYRHRSHTLHGGVNWITDLTFTADGRTLAVADAWDGVRLMDAGNWQSADAPIRDDDLACASISPDGERLAAGHGNGRVSLWARGDAGWRIILEYRGHRRQITRIAFFPDGRTLATAGEDQRVKFWDVESGRELASFDGGSFGITALAISSDGGRVAFDCADQPLRILERDGDAWRPRVLDVAPLYLSALAFTPDGATLAGGAYHGDLVLYDVASGTARHSVRDDQGSIHDLAYTPDGGTLLIAGSDGTLRQWRPEKGVVRRDAMRGGVTAVAVSPDGASAVAANEHGEVAVFDLDGAADPPSLVQVDKPVVVSPLGETGRLLACLPAGKIHVWDPAQGVLVEEFTFPAETTNSALTVDGRLLACGQASGAVHIYDLVSRERVAELLGHSRLVQGTAFSSDGALLASGSQDGTIRIWDVAKRAPLKTLTGHSSWVVRVAFAADGRRLASSSQFGDVKLWDVASGRLLRVFPNPPGFSHAVAFSHDGDLLAAGSYGGQVALWDIAKGELRATLTGHSAAIRSLAFCPDGKTLATAGDDWLIKLWDIETGQERTTLHGHSDQVVSIAFDRSGLELYTVGNDNTIRFWRSERSPAAENPRDELSNIDADGPVPLMEMGYDDLRARQFADAGRSYDRALARLTLLAEAFPDSGEYRRKIAETHYWKAEVHLGAERPAEGRKEADRAIALLDDLSSNGDANPRRTGKFLTASCRLNAGMLSDGPERDEGLSYLRRAADVDLALVEASPGQPHLQESVDQTARSLLAMDAAADARRTLERLAAKSPESAIALGGLAWILANDPAASEQDRRRALALAEHSVELAPQSAQAWLGLAAVRFRAGLWPETIEAAERSIELGEGSSPSHWSYFALCRHKLGEEIPAQRWYRRTIVALAAHVDRSPSAKQRVRELLTVFGRDDDSTGTGEGDLEFDSRVDGERKEDAAWWIAAGAAAAGRELWFNAIDRYGRACELDDSQWLAWQGKGVAESRIGDWEQALDDINKAVQLAPGEPSPYRELGRLRFEAGSIRPGLDALTKSFEIAPGEWDPGAVILGLDEEAIRTVARYAKGEADTLRSQDRHELAEAFDRLAIESLDRLIARADADWMLHDELGSVWLHRASSLTLQDRAEESAQARQSAGDAWCRAVELAAVTPTGLADWADRHTWPNWGLPAWTQMRRAAERAAELSPKHGDVWRILGLARMRTGDWQLAIDALDAAIANGGGEPQLILLALANCRVRLGRRDEALADYKSYLVRLAADAVWRTEHPAQAASLDRLQAETREVFAFTAEEDLSLAIEAEPERASAWLARALHFQNTRQADKAISDFDKAVELAPNDAAISQARGTGLASFWKYDAALVSADRVVALLPDSDAGYALRGRVLFLMGRYPQAEADLVKAVELGTADDETYLDLSQILADAGRLDEYRALCGRIFEVFNATQSRYPAYRASRAWLVVPDSSIDPHQAVRLAELAADAPDPSPWFLQNLAWAYLRSGRPADAIAKSQECLTKHADWVPTLNWLVLALAHDALGQDAEAREFFDKAREYHDALARRYETAPESARGPHWIEIRLLNAEALARIERVR